MKVCLFGDARSVHLRRLAAELFARDVDVHIVTHKPAEVPGATVERFAVPGADWRNIRRWQGRRRRYLSRFLERFDVVNIHFIVDWGFDRDSLEQSLEHGCLVASAWGSDLVPPPGETLPSDDERTARRDLLRAAQVVTACGPAFAEVVARFADLSPSDVQVVPFGVDLELFRPNRDSSEGTIGASHSVDASGGGDASLIVGFHKGFRPVYGAKTLLDAIPLILSKHPVARFEMIGDGPELEECRAMAREAGVDRAIRWLPRMPHDAIPDALRRWSVCVIPSVHEAFGVAALEASATGIPVVASDVCGLRDTVQDGETGVLVPVADPPALAAAVVELLRDPARCREMGRAGRSFVEREYDANRVYDRWVRLYQDARERSLVMV